MMSKGLAILSCGLLFLTVSAAAAVGVGNWPNRDQQARERDFQHLVGGLGSGPSVDLSRCPFCFDVRLARGCQCDQGPIAGGAYFCPEHGCSVFYCTSLHAFHAEKEKGYAVLH